MHPYPLSRFRATETVEASYPPNAAATLSCTTCSTTRLPTQSGPEGLHPGCNASLYKGHFSYEVALVLDIIMSGEITAIPPHGVWVARKPSLEISFLSYQEFYLYLRRIYNRKNNRSYSWDGTSSHSRKVALAIYAAVDFSFFSFL